MGTNFYFKHKKEKELQKEIFELKKKYKEFDINCNYEEMHIAKTSHGWKPVFEKTKNYDSLKKIKEFYERNINDLVIEDEYGQQYGWIEFYERVVLFNPKGLSHKESYKDSEGYEFVEYKFS